MDQAHVVYRLLDAGADPLPVDWNDSTALDYAQSDFSYRLLLAAAFPDPNRSSGRRPTCCEDSASNRASFWKSSSSSGSIPITSGNSATDGFGSC